MAMHIASDRRFPVPADLINRIRGSVEERGKQALACVHETVREVGSYSTPVFADPAVSHAVSSMGGWVVFCGMPASTYKDTEFLRAYNAFAGESKPVELRGIHGGEKPARLPGSDEVPRLGEVLKEDSGKDQTNATAT